MNERIFELRKQALLWSGENVNRHLYTDYEIQLKEYQKFAELIVRECANLFDPDLTVKHEECIVRKSILKHFGVEE